MHHKRKSAASRLFSTGFAAALAVGLCHPGVSAADEKPVKSKLGYEAVSVAPAAPEEGAMDTVIKKDGKEIARVPNATPVAFSPSGEILLLCEAAADDVGRHILLNVAAGEAPKPYGQRHRIGGRYVEKAEWSKDGKSITFTYKSTLSDKTAETVTVADHLNKGPVKK